MATPRPQRPDPRTTAPGWKHLVHLLVALAGWALFFYWWWLVLGRSGPEEKRFTFVLVAVALVVIVATTGFWVIHNQGISRRKGPRTGLRPVVETVERDRLGRPVEAAGDFESVRRAAHVRILIENGRKHYRPESRDRGAAAS